MTERVPISVCICTMDRPVELTRCVDSIRNGTMRPAEILISDDSNGDHTGQLCKNWNDVRYVQGPRRGQGPNRQFGASMCTQPWIVFMDDDAMVTPNFIERMAKTIETSDDRTILAGDLLELGRRLSPTNLTFWGNFGAPVQDGLHETVIFSSSMFPRRLFDEVHFDARIRYGYEDSDVCSRALVRGYRIIRVPDAIVEHCPSDLNRVASTRHREWSRYYTSLKRYFLVQRRPFRGMAYVVLAPMQTAAALVRRREWRALTDLPRSYLIALREFVDEVRASRKISRA